MSEHPIAALYAARLARYQAAAETFARTGSALMQGRVVLFSAALVLGVLAERAASPLLWLLAALALLAFVALVVRHRSVQAAEAEQRELGRINQEGVARARRAWADLPRRSAAADIARHPYADDLDLFGEASLTQLLGPHGTADGARVLDSWLLHPAGPDELRGRQAAVRELAPLLDWRERLALLARRGGHVRATDIARFLAWAESPVQAQPRWLTHLSWLLPLLFWGSLVLSAWVAVPPLWWLAAAAMLVIAASSARRAHHELDQAFGREAIFQAYPELLDHIAKAPFQAPLLLELQRAQRGRRGDAAAQLARLRRLMHLADARFSNLHFLLQLTTLWDVHVLRALHRWRAEGGGEVRAWLDAAARIEALATLAALSHDQPAWCFPELHEGTPRFSAAQLGHPLLADDVRVHNDVELGEPGGFMLITGSNMSGKSTLLRALGLNAVLAQSGGPCCATSLAITPTVLASSIRVQDSLSRGVSYFMAELERLKQVVDTADANRGRCLYLLDEILHGTNTGERRIAARRVIAHLVASGAIGAITTHDLDLAAGDELKDLSRPYHFTERFERRAGEEQMFFDYRLRPGLATSTNALKLMALVGLPE